VAENSSTGHRKQGEPAPQFEPELALERCLAGIHDGAVAAVHQQAADHARNPPHSAAESLRGYLDAVVREAEQQLETLGRRRDAWEVIDVHFDSLGKPLVRCGGYPEEQQAALGPLTYPISQPAAGMAETKPCAMAEIAAVANAALRRVNDPSAMFATGEFIERQRMVEVVRHLIENYVPQERQAAAIEAAGRALNQKFTESGAAGGRAGAGIAKRPHTDLIRRAVAALVERNLEVSAANVRLLLKSGWEKLALEWGDPLREIVEVQVRQEGPVIIEYTAKWAVAHRGKRLVELDADALNKAIARAPKNK
jgi:hypothetical protein